MDKVAGSAARRTKEEERRSGALRDVGVQKRRRGRGQAPATPRRRIHRRRPRRVPGFGCTSDPAPISAAVEHGGRRRRARDIDFARDPAATSAGAAHDGRRRRARNFHSARDPAPISAGAAHCRRRRCTRDVDAARDPAATSAEGRRKRRIRVRVLSRTSAAAARTIVLAVEEPHPRRSATFFFRGILGCYAHPVDSFGAGGAHPHNSMILRPHSAPGPAPTPATLNYYISAPTASGVDAAKGWDSNLLDFFGFQLSTGNLTCSLLHFQVQRRSCSWNEMDMEGMNPIPSDFLVLEGERFVTLQQYRNMKMPLGMLLDDRPAGQEEGSYCPQRLCPAAQKLFYRGIHLVDRLIELNVCPTTIRGENIVLTLPDYRPKLLGVQFEENPSDELVDNIIHNIADIYEGLIRQNAINLRLPAEIFNMLSLMRAPGTQPNLPLLKVHSCMIPIENRGHLFVMLYQYIMDVLRVFEPSAYRYVIKELVYNKYWEILAESNTYLEKLLDRGRYDPIAARISTSQLEHLKFQRNGPCHTLQDAADAAFPDGLRYTPSSMNLALYIIGEMLIASIQRALHLMGRLQGLGTSSLFKWD